MPIYEYRCRSCDATFEELLRGAENEVRCVACESRRVERMISSFSVGASPGGISAAERPSGGGPPPRPCGPSCGCFPS